MKSINEWKKESTFCINLDRSQHRLRAFEYEIGRIGAEFTRWSAIDGKLFYQPKPACLQPERHVLTPTQLACFYSHLSVWRYALDMGFNEVVIFEDDCIFSDNFAQEFSDFMAEDSDDRQIIRLGISGVGCEAWAGEEYTQITSNVRLMTSPLWCAHAYILKRSAIEILVNASSTVIEADYYLFGRLPANEAMQRNIRYAIHTVPNYLPNDNLCFQSGGVSEITGHPVESCQNVRVRHQLYED